MKTGVRKRWFLLIAAMAFLAAGAFVGMAYLHRDWPFERASSVAMPADRPGAWAQPCSQGKLKNFYEVSPSLYRGAQPEKEGFSKIRQMGIKTVVNLRSMHSDQDLIQGLGLEYQSIGMTPLGPDDREVVRFLKIVTDANCGPVFVHCQHGSDRTGTMCAVYRVVVQGWTKDEALREMRDGGYGFFDGWTDLVDYIRKLDAPRLRKAAGIDRDP